MWPVGALIWAQFASMERLRHQRASLNVETRVGHNIDAQDAVAGESGNEPSASPSTSKSQKVGRHASKSRREVLDCDPRCACDACRLTTKVKTPCSLGGRVKAVRLFSTLTQQHHRISRAAPARHCHASCLTVPSWTSPLTSEASRPSQPDMRRENRRPCSQGSRCWEFPSRAREKVSSQSTT